jgi:hypothetical protein
VIWSPANSGQLHSGKEISGELGLTRGDSAEVLELIEEALDEIAFAIEREGCSHRAKLMILLARNR